MNNIKLITKQLLFSMRYFFGNKTKILYFIVPIILASLTSVVFVPLYQGFPIVLQLSLLSSLGVVFSTLSFNMENSTLYKNIKISNNNKYNFNIAILISMLIASLFILFSLVVLLTILAKFKLLETSWLQYDYMTFHFNFFNRAIWIAMISTIEICSILFAISFFYTKISNSEKGYHMMILIFIILSLIFGGTINGVFWPSQNHSGNYTYMQYQTTGYRKNLFITSLFYPFYPSGQLSFIYGQFSLRDSNDLYGQFGDFSWEHLRIINWETTLNTPESELNNMWRWNTVLILPVVWVFLFGILGIIASKVKK